MDFLKTHMKLSREEMASINPTVGDAPNYILPYNSTRYLKVGFARRLFSIGEEISVIEPSPVVSEDTVGLYREKRMCMDALRAITDRERALFAEMGEDFVPPDDAS